MNISPAKPMPLGFVMSDLADVELTANEVERLLHPSMGGVILFTRNYSSPAQLGRLTAEIHGLRNPPLLIAVDHEGGRVQRFREGFTRLPAMRELGRIHDSDAEQAHSFARQVGYVLAAELRACGVDLSFTPVLDLDFGSSSVIGDRAFHHDPEVVTELARELIAGLKQGGLAAVGKHFPGHGYVRADSHLEIPVDERGLDQIERNDLVPFAALAAEGLAAIMPAHVVYPKVDPAAAGFSRVWLQDILRLRLKFGGAIFSDDLMMEGAAGAGGITERGRRALDAGCDMLLVCNDPAQTETLLNGLEWHVSPMSAARLARLHRKPHAETLTKLKENRAYETAVAQVRQIGNAQLLSDPTERPPRGSA
jgi:beta-N-acetylhexosaminidase